MSSIPVEIITKLGSVQNQIWQTVSLTVSEATEHTITFGTPLTVVAKASDVASELGAPMLAIQFAFAFTPENPQVMLIPKDTLTAFATIAKGQEVSDVDENLIADIRPALESIVQGICLAVGNLKGEPVVASGLSIRYQAPILPTNLEKSEELVRTQIAMGAEETAGSAIWLLDVEGAQALLGQTGDESQENVIFGTFGERQDAAEDSELGTTSNAEAHGLDLLMDIPLEISVELGRVKMIVREVVDLGTGSIIEIDKAAGEPVDVLVNGRIVARGEVVVIEDNFGVRITEILNPQERMNRLSEVA